MKMGFSKKLLIADYVVAILLVAGFFICVFLNGIYAKDITDVILSNGGDPSFATIQLFPLDGFGVLLGTWIAQLGISSGAYYILCKSEHKIQLPMRLIEELPGDVKECLDLTQVVTAIINMPDN